MQRLGDGTRTGGSVGGRRRGGLGLVLGRFLGGTLVRTRGQQGSLAGVHPRACAWRLMLGWFDGSDVPFSR